jgi:hypothetical protein
MQQRSSLGDWLTDFGTRLGHIALDLAVLIAVLVVALVAGRIVREVLYRLLVAIRFDALASRGGATLSLRRAGLSGEPSRYVARFLGWITVFIVALAGAASMRLPGTEAVLDRALAFIPALVTAVIILIAGTLFAEFTARGVLIACVNSGWRSARLVANVVRLLVVALAVAMALDELAIARNVVVATFSIVLAGVVLALALAFGLGGRDLAREYLRSHFAPPHEEPPGTDLPHR